MTTLAPGDTVDRYRVERVLGRGGQATVYQVRHQDLDVVRALKVLDATDATTRARLYAEGRILARLRHPNLVGVLDVLRVGDAPALVLEFVGGGSLQDRLAAGPLPLPEVARVFRAVLDGTEAAHAAGVVHRDLKPANVLLDDAEDPPVPRLADFGVARSDEPDAHLTRTGTGLGSPAYMAPEQARSAREVDARADVWSLGALLYALLAGRPPFAGQVWWEVLAAAQAGRYEPVEAARPDAPPAWRHAVAACLVPDREGRPPDVAALRRIFEGEEAPAAARPAGGVDATWSGGGEERAEEEGADEHGADEHGADEHGADEHGADDARGTVAPTAPEPPPGRGPHDHERTRGVAGARSPRTGSGAQRPAPTQTPTTLAPLPVGAARALVVDDAGRGHLVEVLVELAAGDGGAWTPQDVARDAEVAAQVAIAAALGRHARTRRVTWQVRGAGFRLHGTSLGLALAVATASALQRVPVPAGWAFTGGVDLDGRVAPVGGVPAKLRAARDGGCTHVAVPDGAGADDPAAHPVTRLDPLLARLFPRRRLRAAAAPALAAVPALAVLLGLGEPVDALLHYPALRAAGRAVSVEDVVVVAIPEAADLRALRPRWPDLVTRLADAGARAILLDITFTAATDADAAIAQAIRAAGVPVIVPARVEGEVVRPPGDPTLASAAQVGHAVSLADLTHGWVRRARVRVDDDTGATWWHVGALAAAALTGGGPPRVEGALLRTGALRNHVDRNSFALAPAGDVPVVPADGDLDAVRGKLALVGALRGDADLQRTPDGPRYGAEVLAVEIQTLLRQAAPRETGPGLAALITLLTGAATALLRGWARALPAAIVVGLAGALAAGGILAPIAGPLAAAAIAGWARRR